MVGMLRAWKVKVEEGVEIAVREAVVRVRQMGASWSVTEERDVRVGVVEGGSGAGAVGEAASSLSFVAAIWVSRVARSRRSSGDG
jgi:hypothetical protein